MRRTIIIGDIHGCFDELLELLRKVDLHPDDLLVSVGDVVDRGPAPGEVVGLFRERPNSVRELTGLFPGSHWHEHYTDTKPVVFGHHVTGPEPVIRDGRIFGLDTGACHGWNLTALCVPGFKVYTVKAHADHWSLTKRKWQLPVLKTRPWRDCTWPELAEAAARFSTAPANADAIPPCGSCSKHATVGLTRPAWPDNAQHRARQ